MNDPGLFYSPLASDPDLRDILDLFVEELSERLAAMDEALGIADWESLCRGAHQLKGASGSYGFGQLSPTCHELESAARDQDEAAARRALNALVALSRRVRSGKPE